MKKESYFLIAILVLAAVLRLWNLTVPDLITDDALYSFRALGWFDYLGGGQTTPTQWFGYIPWWANLSFHDAPPLVFGIQKIFFTIFGNNVLAARLPFAIFGVLTVYLIYLVVKELKSAKTGLWAAFLISILSLHVWISHLGYLEGIEIFFLVLTFYLFIKFIKSRQKYFLFLFSLTLGLALLTKYTVLFLLPVFFLYLVIFELRIFKTKEFWLSLAIFLLVLSPLVIYNYQVYITRGHFDAALSSILKMEPEDFSGIANRADAPGIVYTLNNIGNELFDNISWPLTVMILLAVIFLLASLLFKKNQIERRYLVLILLTFFLALTLLLAGGLGEARFISILIPWLVIITAIALAEISDIAAVRHGQLSKIVFVVMVVVCSWEFIYSINSNFILIPSLKHPWFYSQTQPKINSNLGFNQLENFLVEESAPQMAAFTRPNNIEAAQQRTLDNILATKTFYFYDETIHWFASTWYINRYFLYNALPVGPVYSNAKNFGGDPIEFLRERGVETFYFIYPVEISILDPVKADSVAREAATALAVALENNGVKPIEIKNHSGEVAFKVYKFN